MSIPKNEDTGEVDLEWILNPECAVFTVETGGVAKIVVPPSRVEFVLEDAIGLTLLRYLARPRTLSQMSAFLTELRLAPAAAENIVSNFIEAEAIVLAGAPDRGQTWRAYGWDEARHFHLCSRDERYLDEGPAQDSVRAELLERYRRQSAQPTWPSASDEAAIPLPDGHPLLDADLIELLRARKTTRQYAGNTADLASLSVLLRTGLSEPIKAHEAGATDVETGGYASIRSRFTAFELFVVAQRVSDLQPGVYRYQPSSHSLETVTTLDSGDAADALLERLAWGQAMPRKAAFAIIVAIDFPRYMWLYRYPRAYRNLLISLGELGQLLLLAGQALGLRSCMTPAIRDSFADDLLGLASLDTQAHYYLGFGP